MLTFPEIIIPQIGGSDLTRHFKEGISFKTVLGVLQYELGGQLWRVSEIRRQKATPVSSFVIILKPSLLVFL